MDERTEGAARHVVDAALKVHRRLGPGLMESVYELCLTHELRTRGVDVERQLSVPVVYDTVRIDGGFRLDLLVDHRVIVELKSVDKITSNHRAQILTYLKLTGHRLGLLINFNVPMIRDGIKRVAR